MHPVNSREELVHSPELREPNAERLIGQPDYYVAEFAKYLPPGAIFAEVRLTGYKNHAGDHSAALLLITADAKPYMVLNELGPDCQGEVADAGQALAKALNLPYREGPPTHWPVEKISFFARIFGYAG
jgi:hypothetical protein